jgi:signal transduction histidine kinase
LWLDGGEINLTVDDDGRGIRPNDLANARSMGLMGMRERASLLDGKCTIAAGAGGGTAVKVRIPAGKFAQEDKDR